MTLLRDRLSNPDYALIISDTKAVSQELAIHSSVAHPVSGELDRSSVGLGMSRIGPLVTLCAVLRELGFEPAAVLEGTGFDPGFFTDPDMPMQYRAAARVLNRCAAATRCDQFGLLLGERAGAEVMGLPGLLLMSAQDLGTGLADLVHYMDLHDRGAVLTLEKDGDAALLGYTIVADVESGDQLNDIGMSIGCNLMRGFFGESWSPSEVMLPRQAPVDSLPWRRFFRAPVRFGAASCCMTFPAHWLTVSLPAANPTLRQYLQKEAARLQSLLGQSLVDEVRRMVRATLSNPPCTASRVAQLLGMHERTLNRRLQADSTSFRRVRDEVLYRTSRQMLGTTSMRLAEVAAALGYAEASAFIHAFTRWSGRTPDQWRRENVRPAVSQPARRTDR
jgi:AraC-like DNA-binding protein